MDDGTGGVCWVDARDGDVGIQLVNFARSLLNLNPPEDWDLPTQLKYCWRNWQPGDWLIVIDDVTNYRQQVNPYKPPESSQFKVLLTTREELGRPVEHLAINKLQPEAALDLLTSLVGVQRIQQELEIAEQLCRQLLDYLPLGLELVGRYLERDADLSLKAMLSLLEKKQLRHRSVLEADPTMTARLGVADAFELSWERLDENAQFLGCLLSLFASADIPWDLVKLAYSNMPSLEDEEIELDILEEARRDLLRFNLLLRSGETTYRLHQLIREFFREKREQSAQVNKLKQAFVAAMVAVAQQIPDSPTREFIASINLAIPHVEEIAKDLTDFLSAEDLTRPFIGLGRFYTGQGSYEQVQTWYEQCLYITQTRLGSEHPSIVTSLHNLASIYYVQGHYHEAEPLYQQAIKLGKHLLGDEHSQVATSLDNLAVLYKSQGRYSEAEPLYQQALKLRQCLPGNNYFYVAISLNNLAELCRVQGRYGEAEILQQQALELNTYTLGGDHLHVAMSLNNLALIYHEQGRYREAEVLYQQTLELNQRLLGENHPKVAKVLDNLAQLYCEQGDYHEAELLFVQARKLFEHQLGYDHPDVARNLNNLSVLYYKQGRYGEAESLLKQSQELWQRLLGDNHTDVASSLNNLACFYLSQSRYTEAELLFVQARELWQRLLGNNHPYVAMSFGNLAMLYYEQGRYRNAEILYVQALEIFERRLGAEFPEAIAIRECLARLRANLTVKAINLTKSKKGAKIGSSKQKPKGFGKV